MTYLDLTRLLYKEDAPKEVTDVHPNIVLHECFKDDPKENGTYLVYHLVYGWCLYGFTIKYRWGQDDLGQDASGSPVYKVRCWASLEFLEDYESLFPCQA